MTINDYNSYVKEYMSMVYRIAFHYYFNREDAEDITQNVFEKLYKVNRVFTNEEDVKAWLIRVTVNECHSIFRSAYRRHKADIDEVEWNQIADNSFDEQTIVDKKIIVDAIATLPDKDRIIIYLFYYEELTCLDISKILKINETAVRTRLSRTRTKLRDILGQSFFTEGEDYEF